MSNKPPPNRPVQADIDRTALRHNFNEVRARCPTSRIMAVIKADGYGHGMSEVAHTLADADEFAVSGLDDARLLRAAGVEAPITLLSAPFDVSELSAMCELNVRPTLFDHSQLEALRGWSGSQAVSVWLKVDTGMGRLGFLPHELLAVARELAGLSGVEEISLMTHLANADQPQHPSTAKQIELFENLARQFDYAELSVANSAGIIDAVGLNYTVRPGLMLYGISPQPGVSAEGLGLRAVMHLHSRLISVRELPAGHAIGYGSEHVLTAATRVGVISCGYGDGFPRHTRAGTEVLVNSFPVPLLGRISMDMISVDLGKTGAVVGDVVTLWGAENPIENVASQAGTIAYELCCGVLPRVPRIYL